MAVDTGSRLLSPEAARERVLRAGSVLRESRIAYKKLDSTLRGPLAAELGAALEASGRARAIIAPAFPQNGRTTEGGVQLLNGVPVHETELARDPHTPVRNAHLPSLLAEAGLGDVALLDTETLPDPDAALRAIGESRYVVSDATAGEHLEALVRAVPDLSTVLWAGSAGLALALGRACPGPRSGDVAAKPEPARRVLAVAGSASGVVRGQVERLAGEPGVAGFGLRGEGDEGAVLDAARDAFGRRFSVALHLALAGRDADLAEQALGAIVRVVRSLSDEGLFDGLVLTGGDTAVRVAETLGAGGIVLGGEVEPGVPFGTLVGPRPYPVVTKAGGFGGPETLVEALRALAGRGGRALSGAPLAVTMGDPAGIGPEIVARTFAGDGECAVVVGDAGMMRRAVELLDLPLRVNEVSDPEEALFQEEVIDVLSVTQLPEDLPFGELDARAGDAAFRYVERATELALEGKVKAVVTAPLNKEAMHLGGHRYPGHTEILAELTGTEDYAMMLVAEGLRVIHVSTHVSLKEAIERVEPDRELAVIRLARDALLKMGVENPRISVAGLNPHAGENGLFGFEDRERIAPAVKMAEDEGIAASGPHPPDTVFARAVRGEFDIVVVQYHDQGHIPIKLLGFESGVNVTVGLPFFRTSVDHGTAFDIAGTGRADHGSLRAALKLAGELAPEGGS